MTPCPRCRTPRTGTPSCSRCGLVLPTPTGPAVPGTITALRVLLGLSAAGYAMAVLMAVIVAGFASSVATTIADGPLDDGTSTTLRGLGSAMLALGLLAAVSGVVELWALVAVAARRRGVRTAITLVQVADLLLAPVIGVAAGIEVLLPVLTGLPFAVTLLVLTWVPQSSRRWFDATPDPGGRAPAGRFGADARVIDARAVALAVDDAPTVAFARGSLPLPATPGPRRS